MPCGERRSRAGEGPHGHKSGEGGREDRERAGQGDRRRKRLPNNHFGSRYKASRCDFSKEIAPRTRRSFSTRLAVEILIGPLDTSKLKF